MLPCHEAAENWQGCQVEYRKFVQKTRNEKTVCVICKKPITKDQRPSIRLQPGSKAHMECYAKRQKNASKPN